VSVFLQALDEVMSDETASASYENPSLVCHCDLLPQCYFFRFNG
jgi:hypothetical protein